MIYQTTVIYTKSGGGKKPGLLFDAKSRVHISLISKFQKKQLSLFIPKKL